MGSMGYPLSFGFCFSSGCFRDFSLVFWFQNLVVMCLGKDLFRFLLFGVLSASGTCRFLSLAEFGKLLAMISSRTLSAPPFLPSFQNWDGAVLIFRQPPHPKPRVAELCSPPSAFPPYSSAGQCFLLSSHTVPSFLPSTWLVSPPHCTFWFCYCTFSFRNFPVGLL